MKTGTKSKGRLFKRSLTQAMVYIVVCSKSLDLQISSLVDYFKKINAFLCHERY